MNDTPLDHLLAGTLYRYLDNDGQELHRINMGLIEGPEYPGASVFLPDRERTRAEQSRDSAEVTISSWRPAPQTFDSLDAAADALLTLGNMFTTMASLNRVIATNLAYVQVDRHAPVIVSEVLKFMESTGNGDLAEEVRVGLKRAVGMVRQDNAPRPRQAPAP